MSFISPQKLFLSSFCPDISEDVGKRLDKKAKAVFIIYDVMYCKTTAIHILINISKKKDKKVMKFGHLIKR